MLVEVRVKFMALSVEFVMAIKNVLHVMVQEYVRFAMEKEK